MRRTVLWVGLVVLAALVAALAYGCGETSFGSCADNGTCVPDGGRDTGPDVAIDGEITPATDAGGGDDGSTTLPDGTVGTGDGAVACDTSKEPGQAPCLLDVAYGVFVSATGQDDAGADETHPLRTITEGIEAAARTNKSRVFVCNGNYAEQVSLDAQHGGISLYGGFDCSNQWAYVGATTKAHVQGPTVLYALRVNGTTQPIVIADITFTVGDASGLDTAGNGNSSVAAFVSNESAGVSFHRVSFQAGAGVDGKGGGTPATNLFSANVADLQGNTASGMMGGPAKTCACKVFGSSQGGSGGVAGDPADDGGTGTATPPAVPAPPRNGVGGAGYNDQTGSCAAGHVGADGASQSAGGGGAQTRGVLSATGWVPSPGSSGLPGTPGQGGGGGGGNLSDGSGGGGCGGCGGAGGLPGRGGGASVALLVLDASIDLQGVHLMSGAAGEGGPGSPGEMGGGGGANGGGGGGGCPGAAGGSGAGGQGGGGGAGGVSVGILSDMSSTATTDAQTSFTLGSQGGGGAPGAGGNGGAVGNAHAPQGASGTKGTDGTSQQSLSQ